MTAWGLYAHWWAEGLCDAQNDMLATARRQAESHGDTCEQEHQRVGDDAEDFSGHPARAAAETIWIAESLSEREWGTLRYTRYY
jgi:hypothetical protein